LRRPAISAAVPCAHALAAIPIGGRANPKHSLVCLCCASFRGRSRRRPVRAQSCFRMGFRECHLFKKRRRATRCARAPQSLASSHGTSRRALPDRPSSRAFGWSGASAPPCPALSSAPALARRRAEPAAHCSPLPILLGAAPAAHTSACVPPPVGYSFRCTASSRHPRLAPATARGVKAGSGRGRRPAGLARGALVGGPGGRPPGTPRCGGRGASGGSELAALARSPAAPGARARWLCGTTGGGARRERRVQRACPRPAAARQKVGPVMASPPSLATHSKALARLGAARAGAFSCHRSKVTDG
jgi:hypothetical protein